MTVTIGTGGDVANWAAVTEAEGETYQFRGGETFAEEAKITSAIAVTTFGSWGTGRGTVDGSATRDNCLELNNTGLATISDLNLTGATAAAIAQITGAGERRITDVAITSSGLGTNWRGRAVLTRMYCQTITANNAINSQSGTTNDGTVIEACHVDDCQEQDAITLHGAANGWSIKWCRSSRVTGGVAPEDYFDTQDSNQNGEITDCIGRSTAGQKGLYHTGDTNTIARNDMDDATEEGLHVRGDNVTATGNVVSNCGDTTPVFRAGQSPGEGLNFAAAHNTIVTGANKTGGHIVRFESDAGTGITFRNNIVYEHDSAASTRWIAASGSSTNLSASDYNQFYGPTLEAGVCFSATAGNRTKTQWVDTDGFDTNSGFGDPLFLSLSGGDYGLGNGSPAIASGTRYWTGPPPTGLDGLRIMNPPSRGAYEPTPGRDGAVTLRALPVRVVDAGADVAKAKRITA